MIMVFHRHRRLVSAVGLLVLAGFGLPAVLGAAGAFRDDGPVPSLTLSAATDTLASRYVAALESGDADRLADLVGPVGRDDPSPLEQARLELDAFRTSARAGIPTFRVVARWDGRTELLEVRFADGASRVLLVVDGERFAGYGGVAGEPLSA